jgi:hypothetical protein
MPRWVLLLATVLAACAAPSTPGIGSIVPASSPVQETPRATTCGTLRTQEHQAPDLEEALPAAVSGRALSKWSVRGRCWLELALSPGQIDQILALAALPSSSVIFNADNLATAVAGRMDTGRDPPFFVFGAERPRRQEEIDLALFLLFGTAGFHDVGNAWNLSRYEERTIAGKLVFVGNVDMLDQDEHQRGRPYLYQTDDYMFLVVTDDDEWAEDAIRQLP